MFLRYFFAVLIENCGSFWLGAYGGLLILNMLYAQPGLPCHPAIGLAVGVALIVAGQRVAQLVGKKLILSFVRQILTALAIAVLLACGGILYFYQGCTFLQWRLQDQALFIFLVALFPAAFIYRKIIDLQTYISQYRWL